MEVHCPACGRTLRISDEHAGKQIRCPACQQISATSPMAENPTAPIQQHESPATSWHVQTKDGPIYGPISWQELQLWAAEGRIPADCQLSATGDGPWQPATELIPNLPGASTVAPPQPFQTPYSHPDGAPLEPHRGVLILVLGLLGFASCPLFSFVAWLLGSRDLREMRAGRMDRSGETMTRAGMIIGMIVSGAWMLTGLCLSLLVLIYAIARL